MEKIARLEGETPIISWKGDLNKSNRSSYSNLHYELFQTSLGALLRNRELDKKIMVGLER